MTEPSSPIPPAPSRPAVVRSPPRRRSWMPLLLVLLAALGFGAWHFGLQLPAFQGSGSRYDRLAAEVAALHAASEQQARTQAQLAQAIRRHDEVLAASGSRLDELSETLQGGRRRLQLAAIEQLLMLAADRAQLAHDLDSAQRALELADQRLAALADPRLTGVREAIASERAALAALPRLDVAGAALTLGQLAQRAPQLPLRAAAGNRFVATAAPATPPPGSWTQRLWTGVRSALSGMFALRRSDGLPPRLLTGEHEGLVREALLLKLEGARLALIAGDGVAFHDLATASMRWLDDYYHPQDAGVRAARADLARLAALPAVPAVPPVGGALALLRQQLGAAP